ncbi:MAG: TIGR02710 family CRISPR-associated CARF protein [Candidatus Heimdallarchaeaceae archaeon]
MRILIMTVGTGIEEKKRKSLAHGIATCIEHYRPDKITFIGSEKSKKTIEEIDNLFKENRKQIPEYEFKEIKSVDDINECFEVVCSAIEENREKEIIIDYTSGTKTMSVSAAIAGMLYRKKLSLISGKRKDGIVQEGTEEIRSPNFYMIYDRLQIERIERMCNLYMFKEAERVLKEETIEIQNGKREFYENVIKGLYKWDRFKHKKALENLKDIKSERLIEIKRALGIIVNEPESDKAKKYLLIDLFNNAGRRIEEGKYDDAIARLYRCLELIEQIRLKEKYGINTGDVKIEQIISYKKISDELIEYMKLQEKTQKKVKIGLTKGYQLLNELGDEIGAKFFKQDEWKELIEKRNSSILAHGVKPIEEETAKKMNEKVKELIIDYCGTKWEKIMNKMVFPKIREGKLN